MAKNQTKRISAKLLKSDRDAFKKLKKVEEYDPKNVKFTVAKGQTAFDDMEAAQETEVQEQAAADGSRDDAVSAEWDFHNYILGAREQVIAQFSKDSNEIQSVGLKKKSEYKSPSKKNGNGNGKPA
jgi:glutathione peroxidase-family protein